ncbi:hypothetical protein KP79_PYT18945 [Mizuhopecten yessoensis]|uniref:Uncharacterized protein n=1 Tax=Mizuhopecten yessoensis TaxID=6573 RepID=A0A210QZX9_MIZYE|nr:hypothetical protein KP79_PYT18945 [Mizuhopecten yessoensis]
MAFFLTQKVDFQVEGISPRTSQIQKSDKDPDICRDTSTGELKSRARKLNAKSVSCKNKLCHDLHARRITEKKTHLKTAKTAGTRKKRAKSVVQNEVFKLCVQPQRKRGSSSNRDVYNMSARDVKTPTAEEIKLIDDISQKLPEKALFDILCGHFAKVGSHTRDEFLRRAIKWRHGTVHRNTNSHCIICHLQRLTAQPIQTNFDRTISSGFSPKSHYDKYTREGPPGKHNIGHDLLSICKKADLMLKNNQERKTPPPPPPGSSALASNPSNCLLSLRETPDSEYSDNNADRLLQIYMQPQQREIHYQCQPRLPPFLLNSGTLPPEMATVYKRKALRGGFLKKDIPQEKDKNRTDAELTKQVTFPISSLGLSFTIPTHNKNVSVQRPATTKDPIQSLMYKPSKPILPPIRRNISFKVKIG